MSVGCRRNAAVIGGLLLLGSLGFAGWMPLTSGTTFNLYGVHFPEGTQVGYAVGQAGTILKTTDGGGSWVAESSGTGNKLNSVYFLNNSTGFAVGERGAVLQTTDGGATWSMASGTGTDPLEYVAFPGNGQTGYIGVNPRAGGGKVLKSTDGGASWTSVTVGFALNTSYSCGMATDLIGVCVGKEGMLYGTTDGWGSSASQGAQTIADLSAATFASADPNRGYLIGNDSFQGIIRYTADGGASLWDSVNCPVVTTFRGVAVADTMFAYVCGSGGNILVSATPTDFWMTTTGVTVDINGLCFPSGADTGYAVGAGGTILRTYDKGIPWIPGVAEGKAPVVTRAGIRVLSNPSRQGIALHSDADVRVSVFDAAGRVVTSRAATKGLNFLPLPTGAYFVKAGAQTARAVVTD